MQNTDDIDVVINNWISIFSFILEKHALIRHRPVSENFCPRLTSDFKVLCKARDKLMKQAIPSKSEVLTQSYRHICNKVNKINGELKSDYFTHKIASCEGDLKRTWQTINNVLNKKSKTTNITSLDIDGKHISTNVDIAESMNNLFCTIQETLSDKIAQTRNPLLENDYEVNSQKTKFMFHVIDMLQVGKVFGKLKTSKGSGTDGRSHCQSFWNHFVTYSIFQLLLAVFQIAEKSLE